MSDFSTLRCALCLMAGLSWSASVAAQGEPRDDSTEKEARWAGQWSAEGLPFVVRVHVHGGHLEVSSLDPATQDWVARNGRISDGSATIEIGYQGVTATALIQLMEDDTAIARALTCQPDYHVVCTLVRNQQARFNRMPASAVE